MKTNPLGRFAGQIARALRNFQYDLTHDGRILLNRTSAQLGGLFNHRAAYDGMNWTPWSLDHNRVVTQGLIDIANVYFAGGAATPAFFIAPFGNNVQPAAGWEADDFTATAGEVTAYTLATRLPWTVVAATTAATISNTASPAQLTFNGAGPYTLRGCALLTSSAKSSTAGKLVAASRFSNDYTGLNAGSKFASEYIFSLRDEADVP